MTERLSSRRWLLAAIGASLLCRICLAIFTYGTNDASMWESSAALIRDTGGRSIYEGSVEVRDPQGRVLHYQIFNHPPFLVRVLAGINVVKAATGIPVRVAVRLLDTVADLGTILLTGAILRHMFGSIPFSSMLLAVIAPAWIFVSGFHANSDPLMVFFLVLSVYLIEVRGQTAWGMLAFAFATGIKVVPIFLLPALLLWFRDWRERFRALLILGAFWFVTSMPWLFNTPLAMIGHIFGYRSITGHWGIGVLFNIFYGQSAIFNSYGLYLLAIVLVAAAWRMNRGGARAALFCQFGFLLFLFHLLTPGFGIQYLAWLTPWVTVLPWRVAAAHIGASGAFCAAVYTYWNRGLPWYYADSVTAGTWGPKAGLLGLATWLTVLLVVRTYGRSGLLKRTRCP